MPDDQKPHQSPPQPQSRPRRLSQGDFRQRLGATPPAPLEALDPLHSLLPTSKSRYGRRGLTTESK